MVVRVFHRLTRKLGKTVGLACGVVLAGCFATALCSPAAALATEVDAQVAAEQRPLEVIREAGRLGVAACDATAPAAGGASQCVAWQKTFLSLPADIAQAATAEHWSSVQIGPRRSARLLQYPLGKGEVWSALVAGPMGAGAAPRVLFNGSSRLEPSVDGELAGEVLRIHPGRNEGYDLVLRGTVRAGLDLCGREALLAPQALLARDLEFHRIKYQRLPAAALASAVALERVAAEPGQSRADLLVVGASSARGAPQELVDGDGATVWSEARGGTGRGEFVVLRMPAAAPLAGFGLTLPAARGGAAFAVPSHVYVATDEHVYSLALPEVSGVRPEVAYFSLPAADRTRCVALVLDRARGYRPEDAAATAEVTTHAAGLSEGEAEPVASGPVDVGVAEFSVYLGMSEAEWVALARQLDGPDADEAEALLASSVDGGAKAISQVFSELGPRGRASATRVLLGAGCEVASDGLVMAIAEGPDAGSIEKRLSDCGAAGRASRRAVMGAVLRGLKRARAGRIGPLGRVAAELAPQRAVTVLAHRLAKRSRGLRAQLRRALMLSVARPEAGPRIREYLTGARNLGPRGRAELLDALGDSIRTWPEARSCLVELLEAEQLDFETTYRLLPTVGRLAWTDAEWGRRLVVAAQRHRAPALRARAVSQMPVGETWLPALKQALGDQNVRVRAAAVERIAALNSPSAERALGERALGDSWPLVRAAAVRGLGERGTKAALALVAEVLERDESAEVKRPAALALGKAGGQAFAPVLIERLGDDDEDPYVRAAAAGSLGVLCAEQATDLLTELSVPLGVFGGSEAQAVVGRAALGALGRIAPRDLARRIKPLQAAGAPGWVQRAAAAALAGASLGRCGGSR